MPLAVYPGSFDPITLGHLDVARRAAAIFERVIVAVYDRPIKNVLFSVEQRVALIRDAVADLANVDVDTYGGLTTAYAERIGAKVIVRGLRAATDFQNEFQMAQINHQLQPHIEVVCLMSNQRHSFISSSAVREIAALGGPVGEMVTPAVERAIRTIYAGRDR